MRDFLSNRIICLAEHLVYCQKLENEKIISQVDGIGEWCDQNGDKSGYNCIMTIKIWYSVFTCHPLITCSFSHPFKIRNINHK